jgi:hypothetical protein
MKLASPWGTSEKFHTRTAPDRSPTASEYCPSGVDRFLLKATARTGGPDSTSGTPRGCHPPAGPVRVEGLLQTVRERLRGRGSLGELLNLDTESVLLISEANDFGTQVAVLRAQLAELSVNLDIQDCRILSSGSGSSRGTAQFIQVVPLLRSPPPFGFRVGGCRLSDWK